MSSKFNCCAIAMVGACNKFVIAHIHVHIHTRDRTQAKTSLEPKTVITCIWHLLGWECYVCMCDSGASFFCVHNSPIIHLVYIKQPSFLSFHDWSVSRAMKIFLIKSLFLLGKQGERKVIFSIAKKLPSKQIKTAILYLTRVSV
jgi:hypothetical protein